ncbi:NAD(P)H-hydrate epimerase [Candidatus Woesearchaeota archaeon]|nr:NAD(P)H-hydrate epimerase [Candidatus Woesearchaeota archaeon]
MITSHQMRELEDYAEAEGITAEDLMENAGLALFETIREKYDLTSKRVVIFAGQGNNGGDGFVAAKYFAHVCPVTVLFFGSKEKLKETAKKYYEKLRNPIIVLPIKSKEDLDKFHFQRNHQLILIDAMLGIGVKGELKEPISLGIDLFNHLSGIKVAVDIPSGINPDTGEIHGKACESDIIICFHDIKAGLVDMQEKVIVVDIGIPKVK